MSSRHNMLLCDCPQLFLLFFHVCVLFLLNHVDPYFVDNARSGIAQRIKEITLAH